MDEVYEKTIKPEVATSLKQDMEKNAVDYKDDYLEMAGKKFTMHVNNKTQKGSFKIAHDKKNNQVITVTFKDTSKSTVHLLFKDRKMIIIQKYTGRIFTFEKMQ